jgi:hypothetical protein
VRLSGAKLFGPVARRCLSPARWTDQYPAFPACAKELDELLRFADNHRRLSHFIPRLESRNTQRDEALCELRVAYQLNDIGFPIVQWEPPGLNGKVGEYLIGTPEGHNVFVEVKSPGWEGELTDKQRKAGRARQPKYQQGEGGAIGNWQPLQKCIASERTYPKFAPSQPNLLVVADDLHVDLFEIPEHIEVALYVDHTMYGERGYFTSPRFENIGGVGIFRAFSEARSQGIEYEFQLFDNPFALPGAKLPNSLLEFKARTRGTLRASIAREA